MTTIVTRLGKGAPLTWAEEDANFTNLKTDGEAATADIAAHIADTAGAHAATAIANTPAGGIAATTVQAAIDELDTEKANLASPTFTGTPLSTTAAYGTDTTQIATTAYVRASQPYILLQDVKADGTSGGTSTNTTTHTRDLNTEAVDTHNLCSLSANQFTLTAGTYRASVRAPACAANDTKACIYNVTGAAIVLAGSCAWNGSATELVQTDAWVKGQFTIAASQALEIRQYFGTGRVTNGLGVATTGSTTGANEIFTEVELWRIS